MVTVATRPEPALRGNSSFTAFVVMSPSLPAKRARTVSGHSEPAASLQEADRQAKNLEMNGSWEYKRDDSTVEPNPPSNRKNHHPFRDSSFAEPVAATAEDSRGFSLADGGISDVEANYAEATISVSPDTPTGGASGPAARKRELERQRRNLVSTRFAQLDDALSIDLSAPTSRSKQGHPARRIDKEAILKDAATRLTSLSTELSSANQRLASMAAEVENLRAEKVELRNDKAYLHSELGNVRSEVHRLRKDNIQLWQAIRRSGGLKSILSADVAKIPANILLRAHNGPGNHSSSSPPIHQPQQALFQASHTAAPQSSVEPPPHQHVAVSNPANHLEQDTTSLVDSFLVFQSPEELGDLFASIHDDSADVNTSNLASARDTADAQRLPVAENSFSTLAQPIQLSVPMPTTTSAPVMHHSHPGFNRQHYPSQPLHDSAIQALSQLPNQSNSSTLETPYTQRSTHPAVAEVQYLEQADGGNSALRHRTEPGQKNDDVVDHSDILADIAYCA